MNKLTDLAKKFQIKLAQVADNAAPKQIDPNAGPKDGAEAQVMLANMKLQKIGEAIIADLTDALGMKNMQAGDLKFTKLRYVDSNGVNSIEWGMAVSANAAKQFNAGVANQRQSNPTFSVPRFIVQLFGQKLPGTPVLPAQPLMIG